MVTIVDAGSWQLSGADEDLHPAGTRVRNESYYLDFATAGGPPGGEITGRPRRPAASDPS